MTITWLPLLFYTGSRHTNPSNRRTAAAYFWKHSKLWMAITFQPVIRFTRFNIWLVGLDSLYYLTQVADAPHRTLVTVELPLPVFDIPAIFQQKKKCNLTLAVSPTCPQHKPSACLQATFSITSWLRILYEIWIIIEPWFLYTSESVVSSWIFLSTSKSVVCNSPRCTFKGYGEVSDSKL